MCLFVKSLYKSYEEGLKAKPEKAKKDITVYKVLEFQIFGKNKDRYFSPYRSFQYDKGTHYWITNKKPFGTSVHWAGWNTYCIEIGRGFHAYRTKRTAENALDIMYHNHLGYELRVVKMVIPKGALYFIGDDNEIASNELIFY